MTPSEIIYKLMKDTKTTQTQMAALMGYTSQGTIANRLKRDNMTMTTFMEMADALGYELCVRPKGVSDPEQQLSVSRGEERQ